MLKILFLADTHLGFDLSMRPKKNRRRRGEDFFANFDHILHYAQENKVDLVIHGGDLFYRTLVPQPIVDMVYERISALAEFGIPIVIVPGNHESSRLPLSLFMQHPNIYYYTKPDLFTFSLKGLKLDVAGFPCVRKDVKSKFPDISKVLSQLFTNSDSIKLLCMHQSVEGSKVGPSDYTFRNGKDVIPISYFSDDYDLILSGHIHRSQILWSAHKTPIIYPGSIERTAFAEKDEEKGFYIIELDNDKNIKYDFMPLPARPMVDVVLEREKYSKAELKIEISNRIKELSVDSILRFKMTHPENMHLLNAKFLDEVLPWTMNYQVAGGFRDKPKKVR